MVACIEQQVKQKTGDSLKDKRMHIIGGTGPVGVCAGIIAAKQGARVFLLSHRGFDVAQEFAEENNSKFGVQMSGQDGSTSEAVDEMLKSAEIVVGSAKAGVQVLSKKQIGKAAHLIVAADANAVPPLGIEGVGVNDMGKVLDFTANQTLGTGALAIGTSNTKCITAYLR